MKKAPWTPEEVVSLNGYQESGVFHPFTCGNDACRRDLIATEKGWICEGCLYTQDWAHLFMLNDSWRPSAEMMVKTVSGEEYALGVIRDRYLILGMKYTKKVVDHRFDCQIYRSLKAYKHATCTCGLLDDLRNVFNIGLGQKIYPAWEYDLFCQENGHTHSVEEWKEQAMSWVAEISQLPEFSWLTSKPQTEEDTEARDRLEWELIDRVFGETDLRQRYEEEHQRYQS